MAIARVVQHRTGAYAEYWRITDVQLGWAQRAATVTLSGYVSQEAREAGKSPLDSRRFTVSGADFDPYFSVAALQQAADPVANGYALVTRSIPDEAGAETNEWHGATEV